MFRSKRVTQSDHRAPRRAGKRERRSFSRTASLTDKINTQGHGRQMRGGIRL